MSEDVPKKEPTKVFSIRITHDLYDRISTLAAKEHRDKNGQIVHYLERAIELEEKEKEILGQKETEIISSLNQEKPLTQKKEKIS